MKAKEDTVGQLDELPLMLGGHSFVQQWGNDPIPDIDVVTEIVATCLDAGIRWFDKTFKPERIALGAALANLGRREEATIACWSHFGNFGPADRTDSSVPLEPHHLNIMQEDLQSDCVDAVVVHPNATKNCPEREPEQVAVATRWKEEERIRMLGRFRPGNNPEQVFGKNNPYDFQLQPHSIAEDATDVFEACQKLGWLNIACTPFGRGLVLDRILEAEGRFGDPGFRAHVADLMLRYALNTPYLDRLIVAMRKPEWIRPNVGGARRAPLSGKELTWLKNHYPKE